jgi:hypothetical protein
MSSKLSRDRRDGDPFDIAFNKTTAGSPNNATKITSGNIVG